MNHDLKFASLRILKASAAVLMALVVSAAAEADINMTITENAMGVEFAIQGSLDVSALATPLISFGTSSRFVRTDFGPNATGTVEATSLNSDSLNAAGFIFPNDTSLTPIGSIPPGELFFTLTGDPLFNYGYADQTPTNPGMGSFDDRVTLPSGYVSGDILDLSFLETGLTLADLGLASGDYWGTSFADSTGGTQTMTFNVVPEPTSFTMMIGLGIAGLLARKRRGAN